MTRAERDLLAAEGLLNAPVLVGEAAAFHAQQAAEKALKAFLTAHGIVFAKTHDLSSLVIQCQAVGAGFGRLVTASETLTPYAVLFRYPGGPAVPALSEAQRALELATEVVRYVRGRLPPEASP
ncbi:MAG: HEPN domain-containing protein [Chloroflexota bacterium]